MVSAELVPVLVHVRLLALLLVIVGLFPETSSSTVLPLLLLLLLWIVGLDVGLAGWTPPEPVAAPVVMVSCVLELGLI